MARLWSTAHRRPPSCCALPRPTMFAPWAPMWRRSISRRICMCFPEICGSVFASAAPQSCCPEPRDHVMYVYDDYDWAFLKARVAEFRDQVRRRLAGELTEDEFKLLRLLNGVYLQLHAYMLRIGIPYGTLSSSQIRALA